MAKRRFDFFSTVGFVCTLLFCAPLAVAAPAAVGEITLVLGGATLSGTEGGERLAQIKAPVYVGDRIETRADGHVHIRFVDGGRVSIRPVSRLAVEDYRPSVAADGTPLAGGAIRFRLDQGVVRSITGRWGEAARERFRLNAPFAAIGIRGTDFVAQSQSEQVRVVVHSGAVTLAPFGDGCDPGGLGGCQGGGARELSAAMGDVMLELRRHQNAPRLLPRGGAEELMVASVMAATQKAHPRQEEGAITDETITREAVRHALPPAPESLVWGRWARVAPRPGDVLTTSRQAAAEFGRERIAENDYYALYRLPGAGDFQRSDSVTLGIGSAQAHLVTLAGVQPGSVQGGYLNLDFGARSFATGLDLHSEPTGNVALQAGGAIGADGTFSSASIYTRVKGGLADGGSQAAYLFEQAVPGGMLTGVVNWR